MTTNNMKTGDVIKYMGKIYLVGDVNDRGGQCDCCDLVKFGDPKPETLGNILEDPSLIKLINKDESGS
jgi:hypothetical protein